MHHCNSILNVLLKDKFLGWLLTFCSEFWQAMGSTNGTLSFYECRFSDGYTMVWWGHSNTTLCRSICLNFLHSQAVGIKNFRCDLFYFIELNSEKFRHMTKFGVQKYFHFTLITNRILET